MKIPFKTALLASTMLTAIGNGAIAGILTEGVLPAPGDFSNTAAGADPVDFGTYQEVDGTIDGGIGDVDFFKFINLTSGHHYKVTVSTKDAGDHLIFGKDAALSPQVQVDDISSKILLDEDLAAVDLTIGVEPTSGNFAEGYRVILTDTTLPEPASLALFSVGLGGLAAMRRRKRRKV